LKGETAKAYVVLRVGATADEASILALPRASRRLQDPTRGGFVADVPKTSTGKIMRRE
jgi:acyl-coenzyme A synthetase/AMP-(fatty) acid ligase